MFLDEWYERGGPAYHEEVVKSRREVWKERKRNYVKPKDRKVLCPECQENYKGAIAARCKRCHVYYMHKMHKARKKTANG